MTPISDATDDELRERATQIRAQLAPIYAELAPIEKELSRRVQAARTDEENHALQCHPDWEYETEVTARKQSGWRDFKAEGWTPNVYVLGAPFDRNWERDDFTDTSYWMRKRAKVGE